MSGANAELHRASALETAQLVQRREISSRTAVSAVLDRISAVDDRVCAFTDVFGESALADADQADLEIREGRIRSPLHGVPIAIKDVVDVAGHPTRCGSWARHDHVATRDSTVVSRLRDAGLILVGKVATHEFAYGNITYPTKNPFGLTRIPGGSSGGSAAAVAARECALAIGSDTAASVRAPAALTGVSGLRPTQGRVSTAGVWPVAWSIDTIGPMARTTADLAATLQVIAGYDPADAGTADVPVPDYTASLRDSVAGSRFGVPAEFFFDQLQPGVRSAFDAATDVLRDLGMVRVDISLPSAGAAPWAFILICLAEAAAAHETMLAQRRDLYGADVRKLVQAGQLVLAKDYIKAQRARMRIYQDFREALRQCDVIVVPAAPAVASVRRTETEAPVYISGVAEPDFWAFIRLTIPMSVAGIPAVSIPCGFDEGLPIGLQIGGRPFDEATLFRVAAAYQESTSWHKREPVLESGPAGDSRAGPVRRDTSEPLPLGGGPDKEQERDDR
jgi:aspartyl-tRNA(Asn)/glutamyl-tRNA(Gln) amidotransferase subunit A